MTTRDFIQDRIDYLDKRENLLEIRNLKKYYPVTGGFFTVRVRNTQRWVGKRS